MRILVCGSEGRIMSHVIPHLLSEGHSVIGIDNGIKWGKNKVKRDYELIWTDCANGNIGSLFFGVDYVIQAAATLYGVVGFHKYPADILGNDITAQQNVLQCSLVAGVKRVTYISSSMVYDKSNTCIENNEELSLPVTDYGLSKLVCERLLQAYARQYGMEFTIWRPFNAVDSLESPGKEVGISHVIPDLLYKIINLEQNPLEILGDGNQIRCFSHIKEIGEVIAKYSFDDRTKNDTYNIGRREPVSIKELAKKLHSKFCDCELKFTSIPAPSTDVRERIGDFTKIKRAVGWESKISLDDIVNECSLEANYADVLLKH